MQSYQEVLAYLFSRLPMYQRIGGAAYKADLQTTLALDLAMGHPHSAFPSVHIAGTNGKGSVSHLLASVFQEAGYRTGLYTSPHLVDFRERIRVNGRLVPEKVVVDFVRANRQLFEELSPSFFEMTVALAFWYFKEEEVDVAVIETGMGGRLDSTNILVPVCSVITNIGLDHTRFLGDNLEQIAAEKAGIIKEGVPVVVGETQPETRPLFEKLAREKQADISFADQHYRVDPLPEISKRLRTFRVNDLQTGVGYKMETSLLGLYQRKNLATLFRTIDVLRGSDWIIRKQDVETGVREVSRNTGLLGRWQVLREHPLVVADVAHNREGIAEVAYQIRSIPYKRLHLVLGMVNDKDPADLLAQFPEDAQYYFTQPSIPRAMELGILVRAAEKIGIRGLAVPLVSDAVTKALETAGRDDMVYIGGSTFVVADLLASGLFPSSRV